jgi:hypothetical protein
LIDPSQTLELIRNSMYTQETRQHYLLSYELTEQIPNELITISDEDYTDLIHSLQALTHSVTVWSQMGGNDPPKYINGKSPVAVVREMLAKCPDQSPSPTTAVMSFVPDRALRDSIRLDLSTATSALHNGEWKASTVLAGSVVEALLLWAVQKDATKLSALTRQPKDSPDNWTLAKLLQVARDLALIKPNTADQVELMKNFRNLIHPGRVQRLKEVCDRATALSALAAAELVVRDFS